MLNFFVSRQGNMGSNQDKNTALDSATFVRTSNFSDLGPDNMWHPGVGIIIDPSSRPRRPPQPRPPPLRVHLCHVFFLSTRQYLKLSVKDFLLRVLAPGAQF